MLLPALVTQCYTEEALFGVKFSECSFVESSKAIPQLGTVAVSSMAQLLYPSQGKGHYQYTNVVSEAHGQGQEPSLWTVEYHVFAQSDPKTTLSVYKECERPFKRLFLNCSVNLRNAILFRGMTASERQFLRGYSLSV